MDKNRIKDFISISFENNKAAVELRINKIY